MLVLMSFFLYLGSRDQFQIPSPRLGSECTITMLPMGPLNGFLDVSKSDLHIQILIYAACLSGKMCVNSPALFGQACKKPVFVEGRAVLQQWVVVLQQWVVVLQQKVSHIVEVCTGGRLARLCSTSVMREDSWKLVG